MRVESRHEWRIKVTEETKEAFQRIKDGVDEEERDFNDEEVFPVLIEAFRKELQGHDLTNPSLELALFDAHVKVPWAYDCYFTSTSIPEAPFWFELVEDTLKVIVE